jgi:hypothetical protein
VCVKSKPSYRGRVTGEEGEGTTEGKTEDITIGKGKTSSISRNNWVPGECEGKTTAITVKKKVLSGICGGKGMPDIRNFPDIRMRCLMCNLVQLAPSRTDITQFAT